MMVGVPVCLGRLSVGSLCPRYPAAMYIKWHPVLIHFSVSYKMELKVALQMDASLVFLPFPLVPLFTTPDRKLIACFHESDCWT